MDYKQAIYNTMIKKNNNNDKCNRIDVKDLPKGWVVLRKDGSIEDTLTIEERERYEEKYECERKQKILDTLINNMIKHKIDELEEEGYSEEEIEIFIQKMLEEQDDENSLNDDYESNNESSDEESEN